MNMLLFIDLLGQKKMERREADKKEVRQGKGGEREIKGVDRVEERKEESRERRGIQGEYFTSCI